jgi:hypothetical protein
MLGGLQVAAIPTANRTCSLSSGERLLSLRLCADPGRLEHARFAFKFVDHDPRRTFSARLGLAAGLVAAREEIGEPGRVAHRLRLARQPLVHRAVRDHGGVDVGATRTTATCPFGATHGLTSKFGSRADTRLEVADDVGDPRDRLTGERHALEHPAVLAVLAYRLLRAQDEVAAFVTVRERADLPADLVRLELRPLRLLEQRLVVRLIQVALNVLQAQLIPRCAKDRQGASA